METHNARYTKRESVLPHRALSMDIAGTRLAVLTRHLGAPAAAPTTAAPARADAGGARRGLVVTAAEAVAGCKDGDVVTVRG